MFPSGENAIVLTPPVCPFNTSRGAPVATSHSLTVASKDPEAKVYPSGENATEVTMSACPLRTASSLREATSHSHSLNMWPELDEAKIRPFGEKAIGPKDREWVPPSVARC